MFMLICLKGVVVTRQISWPTGMQRKPSEPRRWRSAWMAKMNTQADKWGAKFYAFRYRGEWHLCSVYGHDTPIRSFTDVAKGNEIAKMWVRMKETCNG